MALWKDIVAHWDDESRNTVLKEVIRDLRECSKIVCKVGKLI